MDESIMHRVMSLLVLLCLCRGVAVAQEHQGPPPALVRVGVVQKQTLQARADVVGRLRELRRALVSAEQPGKVIEVAADEGAAVTAGQTVLVQIDDIWARIALDEAHANLDEATAAVAESEAEVDQARHDRVYLEELLKAKSAKPKEVNDARTLERAQAARLERARANLHRLEAELMRRQEQLERLTVTAPFEGFVVRKIAELGQWVDQGDDVIELISRGQIDALIDVPEGIINHVVVDQAVQVNIDPLNIEVVGTVWSINPLGNTAARTFPVKVRLDDQGGRLKPGMSVTAMVPLQRTADVLTVPRDSLRRTPQGSVVWGEFNGAAAMIPVTVLFGHDGRYAVEADPAAQVPLTEGMRVVIEGAERLFPFQPLQVMLDRPAESQTPSTKND